MKPNRLTNWIRIALWCLALAFVVILLTMPLLAKGISQIVGDPIEPEKLDVRPIPLPVPSPLTHNELPSSATPAPSVLDAVPVPEAISVPTPLVSATQTAPLISERQMPEASTAITVHITNWQEVLVLMLMFVALLIWVWLHRAPSFHFLTKESA